MPGGSAGVPLPVMTLVHYPAAAVMRRPMAQAGRAAADADTDMDADTSRDTERSAYRPADSDKDMKQALA